MSKISPTLACQEIIKERKKNNLKVYNFGLGANPIKQPDFFIEKVKEYAHLKDYTSAVGIPELNKTIKEMYSTENYKVENVLFGNGLKELIFIVQSSINAKIFHITPSWVSYNEQIRFVNNYHNLIEINTNMENNYKINPNDLERELIKHTKYNKFIIFNSPNNPTGVMYTQDEIKNLAKVLKKYNCVVLSDEIYMNITHFNNFHSICDYIPELTIRGSSVSKDLGCGGYRLGWVTFPKELKTVYDESLFNASTVYSCPCTPIQYATNEMLNNKEVYNKHIEYLNTLFKSTVDKACEIINKSEIKYVRPNSAWYIFLNFEFYNEKFIEFKIKDSYELSSYLLNNLGIVTVPGESFNIKGMNLRFSLIDIDVLEEGLNELIKFLKNL